MVPASAARLRGTEFAAAATAAKRVASRSACTGAAPPAPRSWREEHAALLAAARAQRGDAVVEASSVSAAPDALMPALERRPASLPMGARVVHCGDATARVAVLQFRGPVWGLSKGTWLGIEYADAAAGRCDGTHKVRAVRDCVGNEEGHTRHRTPTPPPHLSRAGRAVLGLRQRLWRVGTTQGRPAGAAAARRAAAGGVATGAGASTSASASAAAHDCGHHAAAGCHRLTRRCSIVAVGRPQQHAHDAGAGRAGTGGGRLARLKPWVRRPAGQRRHRSRTVVRARPPGDAGARTCARSDLASPGARG